MDAQQTYFEGNEPGNVLVKNMLAVFERQIYALDSR